MATSTSHTINAQDAAIKLMVISAAKPFILIVAFMLLAVMSAMAQTQFGVCVGVVIEQGKADNDDLEDRIGYTAGMVMDFDLPVEGLAVETSAIYTKHSFGTPRMVQHSVDLPVHLRYRLAVPVVEKVVAPYAFTGPSVSGGYCGKVPTRLGDCKISLSWNVGAGVEVFKHVRVAAPYSIQVSKADVVKNGSLVKGKKGNCLSFTAAYMF